MAVFRKLAYSPRLLADATDERPQYGSVALAELHVDHEYQRAVDERRVNTYVAEYDERLMLPLVVSRRTDGSFWIVDGQHRLHVLRGVGHSVAECYVYTGLSRFDEARMFTLLNTLPVRPTMWDKFKARLFAGDPVATGIVRVVEAAGGRVALSASRNGNHIAALGALERIYAVSPGLLHSTIAHVMAVWPTSRDQWARDGVFLSGVATFLHSYNDRIDIERMIVQFGKRSSLEVLQAAKRIRAEQGGTEMSPPIVATALREIYNGRSGAGKRLTGPLFALGNIKRKAPRQRRNVRPQLSQRTSA